MKLRKIFQYAVLIGAVVMLAKGHGLDTAEYWFTTAMVAVGLVIK